MSKPRDWRLQREGEEEIASNDSHRWLVTYADMITLLMVFFVVMYALSSRISNQNFTKLTHSLHESLNTKKQQGIDIFAQEPTQSKTLQMQQAQQRIKQAIAKFTGRSQVRVDLEPRGLVISLYDTAFFKSDSTSINPAMAQALMKIASQIATMSNAISIEGHTDNSPTGSAYTSNWDLAAQRAVRVLEFLVNKGHIKPQRLSATTFAQYRPLFPNDTAEHRALNRRVDIVISDKGPQPAITPTPTPLNQLAPGSPPPNAFQNPFGGAIDNPFGGNL